MFAGLRWEEDKKYKELHVKFSRRGKKGVSDNHAVSRRYGDCSK